VPAIVVVTGAALLIGVQLSDQALQQRLADLTARNTSLEQTLRAQQMQTARAALLAADAAQTIAEQVAALESTDGFLK
jgi:hypothetical protein